MIKSRILSKNETFDVMKVFRKKWDGHSKRERMEIADVEPFPC